MATPLYLGDESKIQMPNAFGSVNVQALRQAQAGERTSAPVIGEQYREVKLSAVVGESPLQSRAPFDPDNDEDDRALMDSLASGGQRVPVLLVEIEGSLPTTHTPLDGHRRIAALRRLNRETIKAVIVRQETLECDLITLTAHVRKNLTPLELARTIDRLRHRHHKTVKEIALATGLSRRYIEQLKSLLDVDPALQAEVESNRISATTARVLGQAPREHQPQLAQIAAASDLSDADARHLVARMTTTDESPDQAALALGFTPAKGGVETSPERTVPESDGDQLGGDASPQSETKRATRKTKRPLTHEAAAAMARSVFPELDPEAIQSLSELAVEHSAGANVLKTAGLLMLAGQEASIALEAASRIAQNPGVRKLLSILDVCNDLEGVIAQGWFGFAPEGELVLDALSIKLGGLKQSIARARRGRSTEETRNQKGR